MVDDRLEPRPAAPGGRSTTALEVWRFDGAVEIRPAERRVLVHDVDTPVRARAFDLLQVLIELRDRIVGKDELLDLVWPGSVVEENNLAVQISTLRKLLGPGAIATIPGRGYRFTLAELQQARQGADAPPAVQATASAAPAVTPARPPAGNLPLDSEPLLGRDDAAAALVDLLASHRLVTLVGNGGMGKTRLARAVAHRVAAGGRCSGGAWWVDLAASTRDDQVARAIANSVGVPLGEGDAPVLLAGALATRPPMLLVLDNCEQVAEGVAAALIAVLAGSPDVRVLATSQLPLHLAGEQVWRLDALSVPEPGASLDTARRHAAFALFEQRARARDQRFQLSGAAVEQVITLCRRLGGHALAIEMAAARAPQIGLSALVDHLGQRLEMLRSSQHHPPARQHSLRATLDWSCSLLDDSQRTVLRRLGVFAGAFRLDLAQQVAADADVDAWQVLDALVVLVERGLLPVEQFDPPRYRLAETVRLYAREQLDAAGETPATLQRHGQALARLAQGGTDLVWRQTHDEWLGRYGPDQDDLQLAFDHACTSGDAEVAAETGQMLAMLDGLRGMVADVRQRMAAAQCLQPRAATPRARALLCNLVAPMSSIALPGAHRLGQAQARADQWRELGEPWQHYLALRALAGEYARIGCGAEARASAAELSALEDPQWPAGLRIEGAQMHYELALYLPDHAGSGAAGLRRALALAEQIGDDRRVARMRFLLADEITSRGDPVEAITLCRRAIDALRPYVRPATTGMAWSNLCAAHLLAGDNDAARAAARQALPLMRPHLYAGVLFNHLALLALRSGQPELAAHLLGHADHWYIVNQMPRRQSTEVRLLAQLQPLLDAALDPRTCAELRTQGAALADDQADGLAWQMLGTD